MLIRCRLIRKVLLLLLLLISILLLLLVLAVDVVILHALHQVLNAPVVDVGAILCGCEKVGVRIVEMVRKEKVGDATSFDETLKY